MSSLIAKAAAVAVLVAPLALAASGAQAHAHLVKASPAEDAAVAAPAVIHLEFSEKLEPKFSGVELQKAGVEAPATSKVSGKTIDVTPKPALTPGAYTVMWHVLSADGHKMKGQYAFTVK